MKENRGSSSQGGMKQRWNEVKSVSFISGSWSRSAVAATAFSWCGLVATSVWLVIQSYAVMWDMQRVLDLAYRELRAYDDDIDNYIDRFNLSSAT